jgi:probable rRNA maturation factor
VIELDLMIEAGAWDRLGNAQALAERAAEAALAVTYEAGGEYEASVMLTDDAHIREINRTWRGRDKPTNVLSFPAPEQPGATGPRHLGDIALAYETLMRESEEESKEPAHHFAHLIVHGVLHLLGYDHEVEAEAEIMEGLEVKALASLGIADPYRDMAVIRADTPRP